MWLRWRVLLREIFVATMQILKQLLRHYDIQSVKYPRNILHGKFGFYAVSEKVLQKHDQPPCR